MHFCCKIKQYNTNPSVRWSLDANHIRGVGQPHRKVPPCLERKDTTNEPLAEYFVPPILSRKPWKPLRRAASLAPIAGGTDLLLDLEQGRHSPVHTLMDVTSIAEMTSSKCEGTNSSSAPPSRSTASSWTRCCYRARPGIDRSLQPDRGTAGPQRGHARRQRRPRPPRRGRDDCLLALNVEVEIASIAPAAVPGGAKLVRSIQGITFWVRESHH
jgi:hypothetical protein